ncbi:MAG: hypothetical protein VXW97_05315 [Pseudomonadota bacterium]|nr:hypothetical protein [Pseudomonadota bacterium]
MLKKKNTLTLKVLFNLFFIINLLIISGLINSSWVSLLIWITLFLCIYASKISFSKKKWIAVICITIFSLGIKSSLKTPFIIEGSNVFIGGSFEKNVFENELPTVVYEHLNNDFIKKFPKNIAAPSDYLFDNAVTKFINKTNESRLVKTIAWKNRNALQLSAFNNTKYNAYGDQQPERKELPYFVKYTIPIELINNSSKLCWKGEAYFHLEEYKNISHPKKECVSIKKYFSKTRKNLTVWFIETGITPKLEVSLKPKQSISIKNLLSKYTIFLLSIISCFIIYKNFNRFNVFFFSFSFLFSILLMYLYQPSILDKFLLFEGGNDGLLYVHFAHLIIDSLILNDYVEAFRGGENAYDLMPFYRYFWVLNYILFAESPWIIFFTIVFIPLVVFSILRNLLGKSWALFLICCWYFIPIFEAFGFFHFYYIKLAMRGFAEPLSNLFFLLSIAVIINIYKKNNNVIADEKIAYIIMSICLSMALGLRANILPAFLIVVAYIFISLLNQKQYKGVLFFALGLSPTLIMPIHNFYFTKEFIPLTIAAYKDWNLGAKPIDYIMLMISFIKFNIDLSLLKKITSHISGEIKLYEVWYHATIFSTMYISIDKKSDKIIRLISWATLSLLSLILFYHVGGRYSYLTWTLSLIVFSYWLKNNLVPFLRKLKKSHAS